MSHMKIKDAIGRTNVLLFREATYLISLAVKFCLQLNDQGRVDLLCYIVFCDPLFWTSDRRKKAGVKEDLPGLNGVPARGIPKSATYHRGRAHRSFKAMLSNTRFVRNQVAGLYSFQAHSSYSYASPRIQPPHSHMNDKP